MSEWEAMMSKVNQLNRFKKSNNDFIRRFTAGVRVLDVDASGRILVPKDLYEFAGFSKEIVLSSAINILEIWKAVILAVSTRGVVSLVCRAEGELAEQHPH